MYIYIYLLYLFYYIYFLLIQNGDIKLNTEGKKLLELGHLLSELFQNQAQDTDPNYVKRIQEQISTLLRTRCASILAS